MSKKITMLLLTVLFFVLSCGNDNKSSNNKQTTKEQLKKLVVYSNSIADGREEWLAKKALENGFELEFVSGGGAEITNRLISEKNNPIADVVFGPNQIDFYNMKREGILEAYVPTWAKDIPEGLNDKDGFYHAIGQQAIFITYDKSQISEVEAPKDWLDLPKKFAGKYEVPIALTSGTPRVVISGIIMRYRDEKGDLGISEEGWNVIKEYFKNGNPAEKGQDLFQRITEKKVAMGQMWTTGLAIRQKRYNLDMGVVRPEIGFPVVIEEFGIVKGTKRLEVAKEFIEWFGSAEVQAEWSKEFTAIPANIKALELTSPEIKEYGESFNKLQPLDWEFISDNIAKWAEKVELEIME